MVRHKIESRATKSTKTHLIPGRIPISTNAISNLSLRGAERQSNPVKNEIATPFGLAMTTCIGKMFNAFVLAYLQKYMKARKKAGVEQNNISGMILRVGPGSKWAKISIFKKRPVFFNRVSGMASDRCDPT